ncbi:MAG: YifB family Mg chelatase-like AAA ATPase [Alphaproteobacteria bacterium]|nr:YifB family Mg chelatase-like AAA ATPase [Alphaproteobacteria bacterium]
MQARINTIAFSGLDVLDVDLQVQMSAGIPAFAIVGLPDKTIAESKERVRAAFEAIGISFPAKRITINLAPADLLKEGSHFDLAIACGLLCAMQILPQEELCQYLVLGELGLDGSLMPINGVLPVAIKANEDDKGLICPVSQGSEAAWSGLKNIVAAPDLLALINHFKGIQTLPFPNKKVRSLETNKLDLADIKGQESAKRALEIAAAGSHNMLMIGPPGAGKSMLASRLTSILPPLTPIEALETSIIHSVAGVLKDGELNFERPYRSPHHSASTPALVGGGKKAQPGEISLAHNGVLFLDELPEFNRSALEALRQPLENGKISISRAEYHHTYPAKFQLIAAMNPCRCGFLGQPGQECPKAPKCGAEYQAKISGPLMDRIDINVYVPPVSPWDIFEKRKGESSQTVLSRVVAARKIQKERFERFGQTNLLTNAQLSGNLLEDAVELEPDARQLLIDFADKLKLSARGYHRTLRLARTIADLQNEKKVHKMHIAEALNYRRTMQLKE